MIGNSKEYTGVPVWWHGAALNNRMRKLEREGWELVEINEKCYKFKRLKDPANEKN